MNVFSTTSKVDGGSVFEISPGAGAPQEIARGQKPSGLAVDDSAVYWSDQLGGTVAVVPIDGGASAPLATGEAQPAAIAVDSAYVYWVDIGGAIMRRRKL